MTPCDLLVCTSLRCCASVRKRKGLTRALTGSALQCRETHDGGGEMLQIFFQHLAGTPTPPPPKKTLPAVHQTVHVVDLLVGPVPPVVLPQVLDGGDGQDEDDRGEGELRLERVHHRHEVEQRDEDKVNIGKAVELLEEVLGQEGEHGVLGGLDLVAGVVSVGVLLALGAVEEYVDVHQPRLALFALLFPLPLDFGGSFGRPGVLGVPRHNRPGPSRVEPSRGFKLSHT